MTPSASDPGEVAGDVSRGEQAVRVRLSEVSRDEDEVRMDLEIRLPAGRPLIRRSLSLPFPSAFSDVDIAVRDAVAAEIVGVGLPRQLAAALVYET
ncbi:MAG TPA: hypothetical protein VFN74_25615 [Chloroflexota bacterium]|nr:hypothetical protein [Chloroflexota bacterium]